MWRREKMTIEIDNWLKIPNAAAPGGESLDVAYNMQSMRRIRNLKSAIAFSERRVLRLEHFALEAEVSEELEKAYDSLAEERSHQNNMTPELSSSYPRVKDPDSVICAL